jgi:hypothetical protein
MLKQNFSLKFVPEVLIKKKKNLNATFALKLFARNGIFGGT